MPKYIELKPCPFCGGNARLRQKWGKHEHKNNPLTYAWCECCKARSLPFADEASAVEAWNRRIDSKGELNEN